MKMKNPTRQRKPCGFTRKKFVATKPAPVAKSAPAPDLTFVYQNLELGTDYVRLVYRADRIEVFFLQLQTYLHRKPLLVLVETACVKFKDFPEAKTVHDGRGWCFGYPAKISIYEVIERAEMEIAIADLIKEGKLEQTPDGRFKLTDEGISHAESLIKEE